MQIVLRAESPATFGPQQEWMVKYVTSVVGILKIVQIVLVLIAFLCSVCVDVRYNGDGWVGFATISAFVMAIIWFALHLLNVIPRHIVNQYIEIISYGIYTIFLLIAGIIAAVGAGVYRPYYNYRYAADSFGASAFFCFICMFLWAADTALQFVELRSSWSAGGATGGGQQQPPAEVGTSAGQGGGTTATPGDSNKYTHY